MFVDLKDYGFSQSDFLTAENVRSEKNTDGLVPGRIIEGRRERYKIICEYGEIPAEIKGNFFHCIIYLK